MPIEQVKLKRFRGATTSTEIAFDTTKKFILLFGENGSGKSTLVDAIDMVCNAYPGSIKELSSTNIVQHLPTIGGSPHELEVSVTRAGNTWSARLNRGRVQVTPQTDVPSAMVLRRNKILTLVTAIPSERFGQLKKFIDVEGVWRCEEHLSQAIQATNDAFNEKTNEYRIAKGNLASAFQQDRSPDELYLTPEKWAQSRSNVDVKSLQSNVGRLKCVIEVFQQAFMLLEQKNRRQEDLNTKQLLLDGLVQDTNSRAILSGKDTLDLVKLLEDAATFFQRNPDAKKCPVCQQDIQARLLAAEINTRLSNTGDVVTLRKRIEQAKQEVAGLQTSINRIYEELIAHLRLGIASLDLLDLHLKQGIQFESGVYPSLIGGDGSLTDDSIREANTLLKEVLTIVESLKPVHKDLEIRLAQLNSVKRDYTILCAARQEAENKEKIKQQLEALLKIVRKTRLEFTQNILDAVADESDRLYKEIHPGEQIGGVRFALDEERRGSLHQSGSFEGHTRIVPQAYFSESHLDTLGFCFFLSLAKYISAGDTVVVLDDVFTSVDLPHIERVFNLLFTESQYYRQMIVTTHQRRIFDLVKSNRVPSNRIHLIELHPWEFNLGICHDNPKTNIEELQLRLADRSTPRRDIGSWAGFVLECVLGEMTQFLKCSITRQPYDKYTGAPLLDAMAKPSRRITIEEAGCLKLPSNGLSLEELVRRLRQTLTDVRNVSSDHFNWDSAEIPDVTIREFGTNVLALAELFVCGKCGGMAVRDRDGALWCTCRNLKIINM